MACGADKKWVSLRKRHTGGARRTGPQPGGLPPPPLALSGLSFLPSLPPRVEGQALHAVAFRFELGQHPSLSSCDARANLGRVKELKRSKAYPRGCVLATRSAPLPSGISAEPRIPAPKAETEKEPQALGTVAKRGWTPDSSEVPRRRGVPLRSLPASVLPRR